MRCWGVLKRHKFLVVFSIVLLFLCTSVLPFFDGESLTYHVQRFFEREETVSSIGDEQNNTPAYHYWYAPPNSFGIQETKTVNWSYFKQLFNAHTDWMLEYKRYSYSAWTEGNQYMTINRTWNDNGFWKFNLIFDVPVDVYSARFTFGCDLPVLQYVERSGYEVWINYTANATETYSVMFNWSDIASIPGLVITKGVQGDMFWFRFRRDNIPAGHYEFDPSFGYNAGTSSGSIINDYVRAARESPAGDGCAKNISVYINSGWDSGEKIKCALYTRAGVSDYTLLAETEERSNGGSGWEYFNFASGVNIYSASTYAICVWSDSDPVVDYNAAQTGAYVSAAYDGWPADLTDSTLEIDILCYYDDGLCPGGGTPWVNSPPYHANADPADSNSSISLTPLLTLQVFDNNTANQSMNTTWFSNSSGTWQSFGSFNTSATNTTFYQTFTNATSYNTKYYWTVNTTDGHNTSSWLNQTYSFTTESAPWTNTAPFTMNADPQNGNTSVDLTPTLTVQVFDNNSANQSINTTWYSNSSGAWVMFAVLNNSATNTTFRQTFANATAYSTKYWWTTNTTDGDLYGAGSNGSSWENRTYSFTTRPISWANTAPFTNNPDPQNGNTSVTIIPVVKIQVFDNNTVNQSINATFYSNSSGSWIAFGSANTSATNTTFAQTFTNATGYNTKYYWSTNVTDGINTSSWENRTFSFTTLADTVTITLIDYMPANIRTNNTGGAWFLYNITTNSTSIDPYSIVWAYGVNHTVSITRNTSYSLEDHLAKNKLRGNNRNENMTIESKFNTTVGDGSIGELGEWNVHELGINVTIVDSGSNWTLVNASEPITEHLFNTISFVDNEDLALENKTTQTINIYKRNLVKIEYNMTDTGWYDDGHYKNTSMFIHVYANETGANQPLNVFYANSNYTTGDVTNSLYCELVGEVIPNEAYHFTIDNSSYYEMDFIINLTGFVGSVDATSKYYIILQSETTSSKSWFLHYADGNDTHTVGGDSHYHDFNNRTIVNVTSDDGGSWSANSSTPDVYFNYISLDEEDTVEVKLYANDTSGNSAWSSVHTDIIDITNYAPSPANIHVPNVATNYTVGDTIPINYNWIGDPNLDTCWVNISLWDWTRATLQSYIVNQSITNAERMANNSNFTYNWDTTGVSVSNYTIAINITDGSMWANHSSDIFYINAPWANTPPFTNNPDPQDGNTSVALTPIVSIQVFDNNTNNQSINCTWYSNSSGSWVAFGSLNTSATNTTFSQTFTNATAYSTTYYWTTNVTDGDLFGAGRNGSSWENRTFSFTTRPVSWANTAPFTNNPDPQVSNTTVSFAPVVSIQVFDNNSVNQSINATFWSNSSGSWLGFGSLNTSATNTTFAQTFANATASYTIYYWTTNVTDGHNTSSWENRTFNFTTNHIPQPSAYSPGNNSYNVVLTPTCFVDIDDTDAPLGSLTVNFYNSSDGITWYHSQTDTGKDDEELVNWVYTQATAYYTKYYWKATIDDGIYNATYWYQFTTRNESWANTVPYHANADPQDSNTSVSLTPTVTVQIFNNNSINQTVNTTFWSNSSGSWVLFGTLQHSSDNDTFNVTFSNASAHATTYWWSANTSDGYDDVNETFSFTTTISWSNTFPYHANADPQDSNTSVSLTPIVSVQIFNNNSINQSVNTTFWSNSSGSWLGFGSLNTSATNTTFAQTFANASAYSTTYWWSVNTSDGYDDVNETFSFTTSIVAVLDVLDEYPTNDSNILVVQPTLYFNLSTPTGALMNYTIYIGTAHGSCNTLLYNRSSVSNGTQRNYSQYYSAINYTQYHWRVMANAGISWVNETFHFNYTGSGGGGITPRLGTSIAMGILAGLGGSIIFGLLFVKKKKERRI